MLPAELAGRALARGAPPKAAGARLERSARLIGWWTWKAPPPREAAMGGSARAGRGRSLPAGAGGWDSTHLRGCGVGSIEARRRGRSG